MGAHQPAMTAIPERAPEVFVPGFRLDLGAISDPPESMQSVPRDYNPVRGFVEGCSQGAADRYVLLRNRSLGPPANVRGRYGEPRWDSDVCGSDS